MIHPSARKLALAVYLFCTCVYLATAGQRLLRPSSDTHFVYQAQCFLERRLDLGRTPPHQNDWAEVEYLTLRSGEQVAGQFLRAEPTRFRPLHGPLRTIPAEEIAGRQKKYFVSFPPLPAVLMLPLVALFGLRMNDVLFTALLAGAVPALLFLLFRRLPRLLAERARNEEPVPVFDARADLARDLWLAGLLAFGSVFYFSAVLGQVWFTAHIVSMLLMALFLLCVLPLRHPALAGLCIGGLFLTRPQMALVGLLFVFELLRASSGGRLPRTLREFAAVRWSALVRGAVVAALPCLALCALGCVFNYLRFGRPFEFGHSFLQTMQADNIQRYGLFNYHYLPRNLAAALVLLPKLLPRPPFVQVSYHGMSLLLTTPALLCLLWPQDAPGSAARSLRTCVLLTALPIALLGLLYQNDGYVQFGFRFSLDYMLLAVLALWLGGAGRARGFRALVLFGVLVNLFGAITFNRMWQFYWNGFFPVL